MNGRQVLGLGTLVAALLGVYWLAQAGSLEPPGPPAPTMKPLDEVEPRRPIRVADLPLTITQSGSYYLAETLSTAGGGISIGADDVTLDLMGFGLTGGTGDGISAGGVFRNLVVKNGSVSGWSGSGIALASATNSLVSQVQAEGNGAKGIWVGDDSAVVESTARNNTDEGILAANNSRVSGCVAVSNGIRGILVADNSVVVDSVASNNIGTGIEVDSNSRISGCVAYLNSTGLRTSSGSVVTDSTAKDNTGTGIDVRDAVVENSNAYSNDGDGISASISVIRGCKSARNGGHGIDGGHLIVNNLVDHNALNGIDTGGGTHVVGNYVNSHAAGAGIFISGNSKTRIEDNHINFNDIGIQTALPQNSFFKNTVTENTTNFDIVAGNDVGPIGTAALSTSPWANIEY